MKDTNCDNTVDIKPVLFEHDYCRNGCMSDVEDSKENVFFKKLVGPISVVDKWTERLLVRVTTKGDWNKIIDRETAILKVQYPFLPEQQLRGKAYKKFGIPAVMGEVLSRATAIFGDVIPKKFLKTRKKNGHKMSQKLNKLEAISNLEAKSSDMKRLQSLSILCESSARSPITIGNIDSSEIETGANTRKNSFDSDETESPTPDFEFPGTDIRFSTYSKPTQSHKRNSQLWDTHDSIGIHSAPTQIITPNFKLCDNQAVNDDDVPSKISNDAGVNRSIVPLIALPTCSQIVKLPAIPTQLDTDKQDPFCVDLNRNLVDIQSILSPKRKELKLNNSNPEIPNSFEKSARVAEISPVVGTADIDDFSQLPTPRTDHFFFSITMNLSELSLPSTSRSPTAASLHYSPRGYRNMPEFLTQEGLQENIATKIVDDPEIIVINEVLRKRTMNKRLTGNSEDKENCLATENFREKIPRTKNNVLNAYSKSVLRPSCLDNTLSIVSQTQRLNLNDSADESGLSPERKKIRLGFCDSASPTYMTKDCGSNPFYSRSKKKKVQIVDLREEDDIASDEEDFIVINEIEKNTIASVVLVDNQEKKPSISTFPEELRAARDSTAQTQRLNLNDSADESGLSSERKKIRLGFCDSASPTYMTKDCVSNPFYSRSKKKKVQIVDLREEDDFASDEEDFIVINEIEKNTIASVVLVDNQEKKPSISTFPEELRAARDSTAQTQRLNLNDSADESGLSSERKKIRLGFCDSASPTYMTKDCVSNPFYSRSKKKKVQIVDLREEDDFASDEEDFIVINEIEKNTIASVVLVDNQEKKPSISTFPEELRAARDSNDGCNSKSSVHFLVGDHDKKSSPTSCATRLTATATTEFELLSDHCCEYDQKISNDNSLYSELADDFNCGSSFKDSFKVTTIEINKQVDEILKLLETDTEDI